MTATNKIQFHVFLSVANLVDCVFKEYQPTNVYGKMNFFQKAVTVLTSISIVTTLINPIVGMQSIKIKQLYFTADTNEVMYNGKTLDLELMTTVSKIECKKLNDSKLLIKDGVIVCYK